MLCLKNLKWTLLNTNLCLFKISTDDETQRFKTATKKFMKLFNMPKEEKLVNCKCAIHEQLLQQFNIFDNCFSAVRSDSYLFVDFVIKER